MKSDSQLVGDVTEELFYDPRIKGVDRIAVPADVQVSSDADAVTLSGVVGTWSEHAEALDAAWSAPGVTRVRDELEIVY
jgi:osmotically-inducible protein OsmY